MDWRQTKLEKVAFMLSGEAGVVAFWLIVSVGCVVGGVMTYRKANQVKKPEPPT